MNEQLRDEGALGKTTYMYPVSELLTLQTAPDKVVGVGPFAPHATVRVGEVRVLNVMVVPA